MATEMTSKKCGEKIEHTITESKKEQGAIKAYVSRVLVFQPASLPRRPYLRYILVQVGCLSSIGQFSHQFTLVFLILQNVTVMSPESYSYLGNRPTRYSTPLDTAIICTQPRRAHTEAIIKLLYLPPRLRRSICNSRLSQPRVCNSHSIN